MSGMMLLMIEDRVAEILRERYHAHSKARGEDPLAFASASEFAAGGIVRLFGKWWMRGHDPQTEVRERYHAHSKARGEDPLAFASASEFAAGGIVRLFGKWWMRGHDPQTEDDLVNTAEAMVLRVLSR